MKKIMLLTLAGISCAVGIGLFVTRPSDVKTSQIPAPETLIECQTNEVHPIACPSHAKPEPALTRASAQVEAPSAPTEANRSASSALRVVSISRAVETLLGANSNFEQKQTAWNELRQSGHLDQAISQLEERIAKDDRSPAIPATLGQAYLQKAGTIQDVREQGILGMKADQSFDLALNLEPENWEARFWKATAMSYWPPQLGKGKEVLENFVELVKQQEGLPPQPQFAQVYVLLGEQYEKQGHPDYAIEAWKRGVALFPNDDALGSKLNAVK